MLGIIQDWLSMFLRWAHIIAGIGWIGSSFYFMALDASLKRAANSPKGVTGENWTVHGGGFYHIRNTPSRRNRCPPTCTGSSGRAT